MLIVRITLSAEKRALREKMRGLGPGYREIVAEFARRYRLRPRAAWLTARISASTRTGPAPADSRPSPYLLALLACVYSCTAHDLIDLADREQLPPADLLILDTYGQEIPSLRNEDGPPQLPRPPGRSALEQSLPAVPAITYRESLSPLGGGY
jgi:hypothetical protein